MSAARPSRPPARAPRWGLAALAALAAGAFPSGCGSEEKPEEGSPLQRPALARSALLEAPDLDRLFDQLVGDREDLRFDALSRLPDLGDAAVNRAREAILARTPLDARLVPLATELARRVWIGRRPDPDDKTFRDFADALWRVFRSADLPLRRDILYTLARLDPAPDRARVLDAALTGDPEITMRVLAMLRAAPSTPNLTILVDALANANLRPDARREALAVLREYSGGESFDYVADDPPGAPPDTLEACRRARAAAAARWRDWWNAEKQKSTAQPAAPTPAGAPFAALTSGS
ncbi:MAG: hypothetical protein HY719_02930 [Planctomycetes bacterium]|nr:hypothetical protein [Planctomycetota bacterium]